MISLPIVNWTLGQAALQRGIILGVLIQVSVVIMVLWRAWGWSTILVTSGKIIVLAWLAEAVGSKTGFPFGLYSYTEVLQPQILGVPALIPLAWLMMLPPAWAVGELIAAQFGDRRWVRIGASSLAFTAWDLFLDPQMVAWNFWVWEQPGDYFGIPWVNYLGWLLISGIITQVVFPKRLPVIPLLLVYAITWALESIGLFFFWGLPGPAIVGFWGMGFMLLWAWRGQNLRMQAA